MLFLLNHSSVASFCKVTCHAPVHAKWPGGGARTSQDPFQEREDATSAAVPQQRLSECTECCAGVCINWQKPFPVSWATLLPPQLLCALQCCRIVRQLQSLGSQAEHRYSCVRGSIPSLGLGITRKGTLLPQGLGSGGMS